MAAFLPSLLLQLSSPLSLINFAFLPKFSSAFYYSWGGVVVKALRYSSEGPGIDSRWSHWGIFFSMVQNNVPWGRLSPWKWVPGISPGVKAAGAFGWRPTTLVLPKRQEKSGALIYPASLGPPRPVVGDLYLNLLYFPIIHALRNAFSSSSSLSAFSFSTFVFFWLHFLRFPFLMLLFLSILHISAHTGHRRHFAHCPYELHIMDCTHLTKQPVSRRLLITADTGLNSAIQDSCNVITQSNAHA